MKLIVVGAGNIGLVTALCFAERGHQVFCVDIDQTKIAKLKTGTSSIFEPELDILLTTHLKKANIQFSHQLEGIINQADIIFIAVGTPNSENGQVDLTAIESAISAISLASAGRSKTVIIKSTVPPNTNNKFTETYPNLKFISSPEFLREGSAIYDCLNPDRIIIGSQPINVNDDLKLFKTIYNEFKLPEQKFIQMNTCSAEITKYAANIFLAARVSLINELSRVCEKSGADIEMIKKGISLDQRIGNEFLNAGLGYGGSCFPKDIDAFTAYATGLNENLRLTKAIKETNDLQIKNFSDKIIKRFSEPPATLCIWGAAFKPETDDLREAPALKLIENLLKSFHKLHIYDPKASSHLNDVFKDHLNIKIFKDSYEALKDTDALIIATEWNEFKSANLLEIKRLLKKHIIFDGRNVFIPETMRDMGFEYFSIGRP